MKRAVFPGSFDPMTNGHLDILERASKLFDEVLVAVGHNPNKIYMFTEEERVELIRKSVSHLNNVKVSAVSGLIVSFAKKKGAGWIIKGIRDEADFSYENELEKNNKLITPEVETVFLFSSQNHIYLRSSSVKEFIKYKIDVSGLVPKPFDDEIRKRFYN